VSTATVTLTVKPVNDPPTGTDKTVTLKDGQNRPLSPADFGYADPDQDPMASVRIDTLPDARLLLDGVPVVPGQVISIADLIAGKLVLVPGTATRTQTFDFSVFDGQLFQVSPNTFTALVEITPDVILPRPEPPTGTDPLATGLLLPAVRTALAGAPPVPALCPRPSRAARRRRRQHRTGHRLGHRPQPGRPRDRR
jgi:hypothetical protein